MAMSEKERARRILSASFDVGFNVQRYIDQTIREYGSGAGANQYLWSLIIHSPEFRREYPGLVRADGTLRMSVGDYNQRKEAFSSTAALYGFGLSRAQVGYLVQNGVDPQEWGIRAAGVQAIRNNPNLITELNAQLRAVNARRKANNDPQLPYVRNMADAVDFATRRSDPAFYSIYEGALFRQSAASSGLEITPARAAQLAAGTAGVLGVDQTEQRFSNIASRLRRAGPEIASFLPQGMTSQRALEIIEFGGEGRESLAASVEQALKQREAGQTQQLARQARPQQQEATF